MAKAVVTISAEDQLTKGLNEARKSMMKFEQQVDKVSKTLSKAFNVAAVTAGLVAIGKAASACVSEFAKVERVSSRLQTVWINVGAATGMAASELEAYADAIEQTTYFEAEAVKEAALLLAATESLTEDGFKQALNASIDLAEAMGTDVSSAASTLAKALQDPEAGLSRLKSIGVSFTEAEKNLIKGLQEEGRTFEAQQKILDKVEQKYKGIAQAVASTPTNTLTQISNTLGDIKEDLGQGIIYTLQPAFEFILETLKKIKLWAQNAAGSTSVLTTLKNGGDLSLFSDAQITSALKEAQKRIYMPTSIAEDEMMAATGKSQWEEVVELLKKELERREKEDNSTPSTSTGFAGSIIQSNKKLEDFLSSYGKSSSDYQKQTYEEIIRQAQELQTQMTFFSDGATKILRTSVAELGLDTAEAVENSYNYLAQIIEAYTAKINGPSGGEDVDTSTNQPSVIESVFGKFLDSLGAAGDAISGLISNMATFGSELGALVTALEYVAKGIGEVIAPVANLIVDLVIKPLTELGKAVGELILPVLNILVPILKMIIKPVIAVVGTFQYVGQVLQHWVATIMNWLAGLNLFGWHPFGGLAMYDPGSPGNYFDFIGKKLAEVDSMTTTSGADSVSTSNAISSAGYRGATQVTINIYQEAPVVGDGGMREFAQMIKEEFDNLNYYGVTA